jgi:hypothetical protein
MTSAHNKPVRLPHNEVQLPWNQSKVLKPSRTTKQDLRESDEFLADIMVTDGKILSKGIPWEEFSEREIQGILKIHFQALGYDVTWRHKDDPANEHGVDLECNRNGQRNRVLVSVKKRPKKEALAQIVELSSEPAENRFYVYIGGAAQSFRDKISKFRRKVDFWNEEALESNLNQTGLTLSLKIDNSLATRAMSQIVNKIIWAIKTEPVSTIEPLVQSEVLDTLWGMKDRAVTYHRCAAMAQLMFEDSTRFGQLTHDQIQRLVIWTLDYIYANALLVLRNTLDPMSPDLHARLYRVYQKTKVRSNWGNLFHFKRELVPGIVERTVAKNDEDRAQWKGIAREMKIRKKGFVQGGGLDDAANEIRVLGISAGGLEGTIDDLFRDAVSPGLPPDPQLQGR